MVQRKIIPEIDYGMEYTEYEDVDAPKSPAIVENLNKPGIKSRGKRKSREHPCDSRGGNTSEFKTTEAYDTLADHQKDVTGPAKEQTQTVTLSVDTEEENNEKPARKHRKKRSKGCPAGKKKSNKKVQVMHSSDGIPAKEVSSTERIIEFNDANFDRVNVGVRNKNGSGNATVEAK
ncbi:hypothetical protein ANCCAN_22241 [Ancylostoma caninum]|uniref:Uncharacterized protein n=1 Tax=Ancylostoma caninum TaxID=29170 RepID=A0A368FP57_ANCCA|nr:hypothetical protein ANCCAN_22241 [Ancylostoma caninum]